MDETVQEVQSSQDTQLAQSTQLQKTEKPRSIKILQWIYLIFSSGINPLFLANGLSMLFWNQTFLKITYWINWIWIMILLFVPFLLLPLIALFAEPLNFFPPGDYGGLGLGLIVFIIASPILILLFVTNLILRKELKKFQEVNPTSSPVDQPVR